MLLLAIAIALAAPPDVDAFVGVGALYATGEGTDVGVRDGLHGLLRARGIAPVGAARIGGELDERSTRTLASRKSVLVGLGVPNLSVLSGIGVVERGLFGPKARWDVHVPLELVADLWTPLHLQARLRGWVTVAQNPEGVGRWEPFGGEAALGVGSPGASGFGPRIEVGWREEFGHDVVLIAIGAGS